jgi:hypothetical protein
VNPSSALRPTIFIPCVATHDLTDSVFNVSVVLADSNFRSDYFQNFDVLGAAFAPGCVATFCRVTHH